MQIFSLIKGFNWNCFDYFECSDGFTDPNVKKPTAPVMFLKPTSAYITEGQDIVVGVVSFALFKMLGISLHTFAYDQAIKVLLSDVSVCRSLKNLNRIQVEVFDWLDSTALVTGHQSEDRSRSE